MEGSKFFPAKTITRKQEKKCFNKSVYEAESHSYAVFLKTGDLAVVHKEPVAANATHLLESITANTVLADVLREDDREIYDPAAYDPKIRDPEAYDPTDTEVGASEYLEEKLSEEFTKMVITMSSDSVYMQEKCLEYFRDLTALLDTNIPIDPKKLKNEIINFQSIIKKLESETDEFIKRVLDLPSSNFAVRLGLKDELRDNMDRANRLNSTVNQYFETIMEKLLEIDDDMDVSNENRLGRGIAKFVKGIEMMKKSTCEIRDAIKYFDLTSY